MKKILYIFALLIFSISLKAQVTPVTGGYSVPQNLGNDSTFVTVKGAIGGRIVLYRFADTATANTQRIKNYPFALIGTTSDNKVWRRNSTATAWTELGGGGSGGGTITNIDIYNGDSIIICYSDGSCDTLSTNISSQIVSIVNNGDSTTICYSDGSCVTVSNTGTGNWWSLSGNSLASGYTQFLGSTNNRSVPFYTNNTFKMVLDSNGRLGLGTRTPSQQFVIAPSGTERMRLYIPTSEVYGVVEAPGGLKIQSQINSSADGIWLIPNTAGGGANVRVAETGVGSAYVALKFRNGGATPQMELGTDEGFGYLETQSDSFALRLTAASNASVEIYQSRFAQAYGTTTAAANSLTLPFDGNAFTISGNTQINAITTYAWQQGSVIYLRFSGTPTVKDNTAGGAGTAVIQLSGNVDFVAAAGDLLVLQYNGTDWTEIGRSYAAVAPGIALTLTTTGTSGVATYNTLTGVLNVPDYGSGGVAWNAITSPTADQTLTFQVGESTTWTDENTTEDLWTVNSSTGTTNSMFSYNRTGTALASGNNIMELVSSGANGTNAITATGLRVSVTNTNVTSGTNIGGSFTASGATTANIALNIPLNGGNAVFNSGTSFNSIFKFQMGDGTTNNRGLFWSNAVIALGVSGVSTGQSYYLGASNATQPDLIFSNNDGTERARLTFAGRFGVGVTATSWVGIKAGTATANEAPLKFTVSGAALNTVAVDGQMEVLVDSIYYTGNDDTRRRLAYSKEIGSFQFDKGANLTAANDLTVLQDGNLFTVTGATTINAIQTLNWQAGSTIAFIFTGAPLVKNNTAGGAGTATMLLAGRTDFQAAAGDYLELQYDGTNWYETARSLAAVGAIPTWQQTLTAGSTLTQDNTAINDANTFTFTGNTVAGDPIVSITSTSTAAASNLQKGLNVSLSGANATGSQTTYGTYSINTHTGGGTNIGIWGEATGGTSNTGVYGSSTNGVGTQGSATSGYAFYGSATSGFGIYASVTTGTPASFAQVPATTSTSVESMRLDRQTSGTAADGIGLFQSFYVEDAGGTSNLSNQLISKWTTAANATRTSQFIITGVNSAVIGDIISFEGNKRTMLYGRLEMQQGADVASAAGAIAVGLDGNAFELTGTAAVTLISNLNWVNGSEITFLFTSTASLTDGTANSGTDIGMELAGNANFTGSAGATLTIRLMELGGVQRWYETSRSVQ